MQNIGGRFDSLGREVDFTPAFANAATLLMLAIAKA